MGYDASKLAREIHSLLAFISARLDNKRRQKYIWVFNDSFLINLHSKCINSFITRDNEIPHKFQISFSRHLKRIQNLRVTYLTTKIATIEDNVSSAYYYYKLYPNVYAAYTFIIDLILFLLLEYIFRSNIVNFRWKIVAQARSLLWEYY